MDPAGKSKSDYPGGWASVVWSVWANALGLLAGQFMVLGGILIRAGGFNDQWVGVYAIIAGIFVVFVEYPRPKKPNGSRTIARMSFLFIPLSQHHLTPFVSEIPCITTFFLRSVMWFFLCVCCFFELPTFPGGAVLLVSAFVYFVAAMKNEKWEPLVPPRARKKNISKRAPDYAPPRLPAASRAAAVSTASSYGGGGMSNRASGGGGGGVGSSGGGLEAVSETSFNSTKDLPPGIPIAGGGGGPQVQYNYSSSAQATTLTEADAGQGYAAPAGQQQIEALAQEGRRESSDYDAVTMNPVALASATSYEGAQEYLQQNTAALDVQQAQQAPHTTLQLQGATPIVWESAIDPSSGDTYYINTQTNETQWERPPEFVQGIDHGHHPGSEV